MEPVLLTVPDFHDRLLLQVAEYMFAVQVGATADDPPVPGDAHGRPEDLAGIVFSAFFLLLDVLLLAAPVVGVPQRHLVDGKAVEERPESGVDGLVGILPQ